MAVALLSRKHAYKTPFVFSPNNNSCFITVAIVTIMGEAKFLCFFLVFFFGAVKIISSFDSILFTGRSIFCLLDVYTI